MTISENNVNFQIFHGHSLPDLCMNYVTTQPFQKKVKYVIESLFVIFFKYVKIFLGLSENPSKTSKTYS